MDNVVYGDAPDACAKTLIRTHMSFNEVEAKNKQAEADKVLTRRNKLLDEIAAFTAANVALARELAILEAASNG